MFKQCQKQIVITIIITTITISKHRMKRIEEKNNTSSLDQRFGFGPKF